jgi:hypothetical protein
MTCALDGLEHAVREDKFTEGTRHGRYRSVCERLLAPRALTAPPGALCDECAATVNHRPDTTASSRHPSRRRPRWRWLGGHRNRH